MYKINHNYFDNWSYNSAYIQGFTMSDGCIDDKNGHKLLCYNISKKDISVLEFIRNEICPDKPIYLNDKKNMCYLSIWSENIINKLSSYGITPRKTGNEILPNIPDEYKSSYLLGLFDGDGNICSYKRVRKSGKRKGSTRHDYEYRIFSLSSSFLESVKKELCFNYGNITWAGTCYSYRISKASHIEKIYNFMYNSKSSFKLERKFKIFNSIPNSIQYVAFNDSKSLEDWILDDRCLIKNKRLILERIKLSNYTFERAITQQNKRKEKKEI